MKSLQDIMITLRGCKDFLRDKYKVKELKIFGSYLSNTQKEDSDIDIIVEFEETPSFIEFIRLKYELENLLDDKVDLLTESSISPYIKPYIKDTLLI
ncbi:MAG: nucleotidyltransferase family protein [Hydrogenobaculum sp.]|nr:MAG: nucleotidyltransferase [Hydrogenobaculum sp.]